MTDTDLSNIERALGITLAENYRQLMRSEVIHQLPEFPIDVIWNSVKFLIAENLELRRNGFVLDPWPAHRLAIGAKGNGDYHFLDLDKSGIEVFLASHEGEPVAMIAPNVQAFAESTRRMIEESMREVDKRLAQAPAMLDCFPIYIDRVVPSGKKWWQFWKRRLIRSRR